MYSSRYSQTIGKDLRRSIRSTGKDSTKGKSCPHENGEKKMLSCGNPEEMGYIGYLCMGCGQGSRVVAMSCKSSMCLRCGKVYVDEWVSQVSKTCPHENGDVA